MSLVSEVVWDESLAGDNGADCTVLTYHGR